MVITSLGRAVAEQRLAVVAAEQEGEPVQVLAQLADDVCGETDELFQECAEAAARGCTGTGPGGGSGGGAAFRAPRCRYRSPAGTGQGRVRASSPSLVMTIIWVLSIRSVTRCPGSW